MSTRSNPGTTPTTTSAQTQGVCNTSRTLNPSNLALTSTLNKAKSIAAIRKRGPVVQTSSTTLGLMP